MGAKIQKYFQLTIIKKEFRRYIDVKQRKPTAARPRRNLLTLGLLAFVLTACTDDFEPPAFLHVDGVSIVAPSQNAFTQDSGFYTSNIVAAYAVAHYPGASSVDTLGLFRLPFTVPVLHNGPVDYIEIYPAIPYSGIMSTLPYYPFYTRIHIGDTTLHSGDTLNLGTLQTTYDPLVDYPLIYEAFEPNEAGLLLDSVEWIRHDREGARSGEGYGRVHVDPGVAHVDFAINTGNFFVVTDPTKLVYLELDIRSDLTTAVSMTSRRSSGANLDTRQVMNINPADRWTHLYINLGTTWADFNHHPEFKISFSALNTTGEGGDVYLDNLKILTTSKVF